MAILSDIRKRPWILIGIIALGLLAFVLDPQSLQKYFGKDPNVLGEVNGEKITYQELQDQIFMLQQQTGQNSRELVEERAWQSLVQSILIRQQFEKLGFQMTDELFWNQIQFDPMVSQNRQLFDSKGNFKAQELKQEIERMKAQNPEAYANWQKMREGIENRIMARLFLGNATAGITANKLAAGYLIKQKNDSAKIDYVKVNYAVYASKHKIEVTNKDLEAYIQKYPKRFKTEASRNVGVVLFPAKPSEADLKAATDEINQLNNVGIDLGEGVQSFKQTSKDSLFVAINSDVPFNGQYLSLSQEPEQIRDFLKTASVGATFGPYNVEDKFLVVSKLLDKKPMDSVRARHILITYKGNPAAQGQQITRSKEAAKKLADSLGQVIKANPAKFAELVQLSDDKGSAQRGGELGWITKSTPLVPKFLDYVLTHPTGATGVVESQYGYHIINIQDRKSGSMGYKVANLVKRIKISDATTSKLYAEANQFIQDVSGKSFNDFKNVVEKKNYTFANPKAAKRFQGTIQGIGTDKDDAVLAWAFDAETQVGQTNIFTTSDGDYVVAYLAGKQKKGLATPEAVRAMIEPEVKNELLAKKIIADIKAKKATSLEALAKAFNTTKDSATVTMVNPFVGESMEPRVAGVAFATAKNKLSEPIKGQTGVYVVKTIGITHGKGNEDVNSVAQMLQTQGGSIFGRSLLQSLYDNAEIEDYRNEAYKKLGISN